MSEEQAKIEIDLRNKLCDIQKKINAEKTRRIESIRSIIGPGSVNFTLTKQYEKNSGVKTVIMDTNQDNIHASMTLEGDVKVVDFVCMSATKFNQYMRQLNIAWINYLKQEHELRVLDLETYIEKEGSKLEMMLK